MLKKIQIKNFKTCNNVKIEMKYPLMAIVGKNAAGKTNLLTGIDKASEWCLFRSIAQNEANPLLKKGFSAQFEFNIRKAKCTYKYTIYGRKKQYIKDSLDIEIDNCKINVFSKKLKNTLYVNGIDGTTIISPDDSGLNFILSTLLSDEKKSGAIKNISKYSGQLFEIFKFLFNVKYYGVQNQPNLKYFWVKDFDDWKDTNKYDDDDTNFSYQFYDFYKNRSEDFKEYLSILKSIGLIEDIQCLELSPGTGELPLPPGEILIFFHFKLWGQWIPYMWLSDGTRRIVRLLFNLLYDNASLMLIEEPESSIHWGLLSKLLAILEKYTDNNKKILISTHSEQILNNLKPEQLLYLYYDKGITNIKYINKQSLSRIKKFLDEVGPLGEYATSGGLEDELND